MKKVLENRYMQIAIVTKVETFRFENITLEMAFTDVLKKYLPEEIIQIHCRSTSDTIAEDEGIPTLPDAASIVDDDGMVTGVGGGDIHILDKDGVRLATLEEYYYDEYFNEEIRFAQANVFLAAKPMFEVLHEATLHALMTNKILMADWNNKVEMLGSAIVGPRPIFPKWYDSARGALAMARGKAKPR